MAGMWIHKAVQQWAYLPQEGVHNHFNSQCNWLGWGVSVGESPAMANLSP